MSYFSYILSTVVNEQVVRFALCWTVRVGVIEQVLDSNENLLHCNTWPPVLVFIQYAETDCARRVHVGVK